MRNRIVGGMLGLVVGDALGVPVEFTRRAKLDANPVRDMTGFGTHNQPVGTWSDDSSLALATAESLLDGYDPREMMARFSRWLHEGYMTPHGRVFDIGRTTRSAIAAFDRSPELAFWGGTDEQSNGNGSLMRILPLALHSVRCRPQEIMDRAFEVSALTHSHVRSQLCCGYYCLLVKAILDGYELREAMVWAAKHLSPRAPGRERRTLAGVLTGEVLERPRDEVFSGGYVVETLEASLWCCAHFEGYRGAVLAAVNLGGDTDTTAAVAGGLAGAISGGEAIPAEWVAKLARGGMVEDLTQRLAERIVSANG